MSFNNSSAVDRVTCLFQAHDLIERSDSRSRSSSSASFIFTYVKTLSSSIASPDHRDCLGIVSKTFTTDENDTEVLCSIERA